MPSDRPGRSRIQGPLHCSRQGPVATLQLRATDRRRSIAGWALGDPRRILRVRSGDEGVVQVTDAQVAPDWAREEVDGFVRSASAIVDLGHPAAAPEAPRTTLYLDVEEDEDLVEFAWRFATSEEEANFGEAEYGSGRSVDLVEAQADCWAEVVEFLRREGYSNDEIVGSV